MDIIFVKKKYLYNDSGGFGILTAIILACLIMAIAAPINILETYSKQIVLQQSMDSALISSYSDIKSLKLLDLRSDEDKLLLIIKNHLQDSLPLFFSKKDKNTILSNLNVSICKNNRKDANYEIALDCSYRAPIFAFSHPIHPAGNDGILISARSSVLLCKHHANAVSLMMVIDVSESMNQTLSLQDLCTPKTRLDMVKSFTGRLLDNLQSNSKIQDVLRAGAITFNEKLDRDLPLRWGIKTLKRDIQSIRAVGSTNSFPAMQLAEQRLFSIAEGMEHRRKGHKEYKKDVILLTDGDNTVVGSDKKTIEICGRIKAQQGTIYVILLSLSPTDLHRKCASSPDKIYQTDDVQQMRKAFDLIGEDISKENFRFIQ
ncbi:MAG: VWA domain-containing protein [Candidatus Liberibacter ctenarytainae]|uniref:VWA domain-containing protein n=1 Tax=Candidatus Liberibacter ctenarytainae TaxID=2020335 RepID=A0A937AFH8_9HYPH|nr:VWA domain-containing protein [Candidatus Liberibacter ctenarytainae]